MNPLKLNITSVSFLSGTTSIGVTINLNQDESGRKTLTDFKTLYHNCKIKIKTAKKELTAKILDIDGYTSNYDSGLLNLFFLTDLDPTLKIETGNAIIILK